MRRHKIYLAASLFTPYERARNSEMANFLQQLGFDIFLPQNIQAPVTPSGIDLHPVYIECVRQLDIADVVVAIVDGAEVDTGVAWELGYAFARKKPTICVRTDYRRSESNGVNIMIEYSASRMVYVRGYKDSPRTVLDEMIKVINHMLEEENSND